MSTSNLTFSYVNNNPAGASKAWYSSKSSYNKSAPVGNPFTQMVWKSTTSVGFGIANKTVNGTLNYYVAAYYNPAGNVVRAGSTAILTYGANVLGV